MRKYSIISLLVVAACLSCGGNNPVPTIGMNHSGTNADAILSTRNEPVADVIILKENNHHSQKQEKFTQEKLTQKDDFTSDDIISPAKEFDVPKEHYQLTAESGGTFTYEKTGSKVSIPPDALVDKNGNAVKGKVDISYREFHTQKEIFFSGIPMDFDVNGEKQYFESAGMIDISASQKGEEVFVKKGSEISFNMSTDNRNKEVKLYELDKKSKKWTEIGEAPVVINPRQKRKIWGAVYKDDIITTRSRDPFYIRIKDYVTTYSKKDKEYKRKLRFNIHMPKNMQLKNQRNKNDFKHANWLNSATFEVQGMRRREFKKLMDQFRKIKLREDSYTYYYKEIQADVSITNVNYPYMTLELTYEGKKTELEVQLYYGYARSDKRKKKIFNAIANFPMNNFDGRQVEHQQNTYCVERYDSIYPTGSEEWMNKSIVQREFQAKNFGILNCDQPKALPHEMIANASFYNDDEEFVPTNVVLTDFDRNVMFTYYSNFYGKFGYNPEVKNFIFTVDAEGMVSYILPEEINAIEDKTVLKLNMHRIHMQDFGKVMEELFPAKTEYSYTL